MKYPKLRSGHCCAAMLALLFFITAKPTFAQCNQQEKVPNTGPVKVEIAVLHPDAAQSGAAGGGGVISTQRTASNQPEQAAAESKTKTPQAADSQPAYTSATKAEYFKNHPEELKRLQSAPAVIEIRQADYNSLPAEKQRVISGNPDKYRIVK